MLVTKQERPGADREPGRRQGQGGRGRDGGEWVRVRTRADQTTPQVMAST